MQARVYDEPKPPSVGEAREHECARGRMPDEHDPVLHLGNGVIRAPDAWSSRRVEHGRRVRRRVAAYPGVAATADALSQLDAAQSYAAWTAGQ